VHIVGDIKLRQPTKPGNVCDIVALEDRHLAETGENQDKNGEQITISNETMVALN
jgi:hypothetical protein